jgi:hypothetical protein
MIENPDLHALTREHGTATIADVLQCSIRTLEDLRRGQSALTIDDFLELINKYPSFDLKGTIRRIGAERERKKRSRKFRH